MSILWYGQAELNHSYLPGAGYNCDFSLGNCFFQMLFDAVHDKVPP
jgi:hypothetical protein